jgi:hypothetical protein
MLLHLLIFFDEKINIVNLTNTIIKPHLNPNNINQHLLIKLEFINYITLSKKKKGGVEL